MGEVFLEIRNFPLEKGVERREVFLAIRELRWDMSFGEMGTVFFEWRELRWETSFLRWVKSILSEGS